MEPGSAAYNLSACLRILGPLDIGVLTHCLEEIARRHESLRTTFSARDGEPLQVIAPFSGLSVVVIDRSGIPAAGRDAVAQQIIQEEIARPFDL